MTLFLLIIILLLLCIYYLLNNLCKVVVYPKIKSYEKTYKTQIKDHNLEDFFSNIYKEEIKIKSTYGYNLHGYFIPQNNNDKVVVICHGITANLYSSVKYMKLFYDKGFSVLIYDHRNHGKNEKNYSTMGNYEKYDLKTCVDWLELKINKNFILGVHGESMGAATVMEYCGIDHRVNFCIEDCGYSDVTDLLAYRLKKDYKIPFKFVVHLANVLMKFKYKWSFTDTSPIKTVSSLSIPILFIHGSKDDYVPTYMVNDLYNAKNIGYKELYICNNASHALSYSESPNNYAKIVNNFLDTLGF